MKTLASGRKAPSSLTFELGIKGQGKSHLE